MIKRLKKTALFLLLILFSSSMEAQNIYTGKVRDTKGNPISGATVRGKGLMSSTITNMDGSFSLETTLPIQRIEASFPGKRTASTKIKSSEDVNLTLKNPSWLFSYKPDRYRLFVNAETTIADCHPLGLMVGYVKNWGVYGRFTYASTPSTNGDIDTGWYKYFYYKGGDAKTGYTCFALGGMRRIVRTLHLYTGLAYQNYKVAYEHYNGGYYKNKEKSCDGLSLDIGLMSHFGHVAINGGMTYTENCLATHIGIGYAF